MSIPDVKYPYLPPGHTFKYVPVDHPHMQAARQAAVEHAGDPLFPVGIVLVRNGEVVARAGNGFNRGPGEPHVCPRLLAFSKTGEGYELCHLHDADGHAEGMLMKVAKEAGIPTEGADSYMYGHWWACEPCWKALLDGGVRDVYVVDDAHVRFGRDVVYRETLKDYPEDVRKYYGAL